MTSMTCQICLSEYDHSKHKPYSLSNCPHTFCIECIIRVKNKKCPMCQTFFRSYNPNLSLLEFVPQSAYDKAKSELEKIYNEANNIHAQFKVEKEKKIKENAKKLDAIKTDLKQKAEEIIQKVSIAKRKLTDEVEYYKASLAHRYDSKLTSSAQVDFKLYQIKTYLDTNKLEQDQFAKTKEDLKETIDKLNKMTEEFNNLNHQELEVKLDPVSDPLDLGELKTLPKTCEEYYELGNKLRGDSKYDAAVYFFNKALDLNPNNKLLVEIYIAKGQAFKMKKNYSASLECFNKAKSLNNKNALVYHLKGDLLVSMRKYWSAVKAFNKAIKLEPDNELYRFSKSDLLRDIGRDLETDESEEEEDYEEEEDDEEEDEIDYESDNGEPHNKHIKFYIDFI